HRILIPSPTKPIALLALFSRSLHDALPIYDRTDSVFIDGKASLPSFGSALFESATCLIMDGSLPAQSSLPSGLGSVQGAHSTAVDRKSTRLNSSHVKISYAVFCLKNKIKTT